MLLYSHPSGTYLSTSIYFLLKSWVGESQTSNGSSLLYGTTFFLSIVRYLANLLDKDNVKGRLTCTMSLNTEPTYTYFYNYIIILKGKGLILLSSLQ